MRLAINLLLTHGDCYCADLPACIGGKCDYCTAEGALTTKPEDSK